MVPDKALRAFKEVLAENDELRTDVARLGADVARLSDENVQLRQVLETSRRAGKRQAAPFSKGTPKEQPKKPGRRAGAEYGKKAHREPPDHVDETVAVGLPKLCECGGCVEETGSAVQYQEEMPEPKPIVTRFDISIGRCRQCGRRVQGHDLRQTSDAIGAAGAQVGPRAQAMAGLLMKRLGLSAVKTREVMERTTGVIVTPGGLIQAAQRLGVDASPAYEALCEFVKKSPVVSPDETGWRIGGRKAWLWTAATKNATIYRIEYSRGFDAVMLLLGEHYSGIVVRDGWGPYRQLTDAEHQTCLAHLLRRCNEILEVARGRAREIPLAVRAILKDALAVRDRRDLDELDDRGVRREFKKLQRRMIALLERPSITYDENRKLLNHLDTEYDALFTFLRHRDVDATNWRAEQAIRPAVVNRKVSGGNRTTRGARTQEVLMSVMQTCRQRGVDVIDFLSEVQHRQPSGSPELIPLGSG